jgi:CubicO group peptidase (beta-lactamase class C family)
MPGILSTVRQRDGFSAVRRLPRFLTIRRPGNPVQPAGRVSKDAGGGLVSTVTDIATFYTALLDGHLLETALLDAMQHAESPNYRLGLQLEPSRCGHGRGHFGRLPGFTTAALASPDGQTAVVLARYGDRRDPMEFAQRLFCEVAP